MHFWIEAAERDWAIQTPTGECCVRLGDGVEARLTPPYGQLAAEDVRVLPVAKGAGSPEWVLVAGQQVRLHLNGEPLQLGLRVLRHKDEIRIGGQRCYFSTEELAKVIAFEGLAQPVFCPRCKEKIEPGDLCVRCPNCGAYHHQSERFPCWTYAPTCAVCGQQSTELDAGYSWTPEML